MHRSSPLGGRGSRRLPVAALVLLAPLAVACTPIDRDYFAERCAGHGLKADSEAYGQCLERERAVVRETLRSSRPTGP